MTADVDVRLITVRPPWSYALTYLGKPVENRTGSTSYRGPVFVQAGLTWDRRAMSLVHLPGGDSQALYRLRAAPSLAHPGHVVALTELLDCHPDDGSCCGPWAERSFDLPAVGRQVINHLVLAPAVPLAHPVPARGRLGLPWRADADLAAVLRPHLQQAGQQQRPVDAEPPDAGAVYGDDDPPDDDPRCRDCDCPMAVHNHPRFGGGCEVCGIECDGWR